MRLLKVLAASVSTAALALNPSPPPLKELPRSDRSGGPGDATTSPPSCSPKLLGQNLDAAGHDLVQSAEPKTSASCAAACCANPKCGGALFEPISTVTYHACKAGAPCCFMKSSVADHKPMAKPVKGGSELWEIPGRSQDDEKLSFLSATLGSHMVLQRAPQQAVLWGFTAPGATVTTAMSSDACRRTATMDARIPSGCAAQMLTTTADPKGTWRQKLPATPASKTSYTFNISSDSAVMEQVTITDVLFGDVYLCGGQSNMEFSMAAVANRTAEKQAANDFPTIRYFSVGHRTASPTPLRNLQTIWEPWQVASNTTINQNYGPGHTLFSTFSAVCWLFGKELSQQLSPTGDIPLGLISNNWGGTKVEVWTPHTAFAACNRSDATDGPMFNAMILPYAEGPMALRGITFYQGEANTANSTTADQYSCLFPQMISAWREALGASSLWFGFIQLSTWCALPPQSLPQMRDAQLAALSLPNVGYATNADHGFGCNIHPSAKQYCSKRLAHTALSQVYHKPAFAAWRSPTYHSATQLVHKDARRNQVEVSLVVTLNDLSAKGLKAVHPFNYASPQYGSNASAPLIPVDCSATFPATYPNRTAYNASMAQQCAWASLHVDNLGWLNATVSVAADKMTLTATLPATSSAGTSSTVPQVIRASAYGWGPIPMMTGACHMCPNETTQEVLPLAYDMATDLPVLPWNRSVDQISLVSAELQELPPRAAAALASSRGLKS